MKKSKCVFAVFVIFFIVLSTISILTLITPEKTNAGNWAEVWCGKSCVGGDYCKGTGKYTCCKFEPVPVT